MGSRRQHCGSRDARLEPWFANAVDSRGIPAWSSVALRTTPVPQTDDRVSEYSSLLAAGAEQGVTGFGSLNSLVDSFKSPRRLGLDLARLLNGSSAVIDVGLELGHLSGTVLQPIAQDTLLPLSKHALLLGFVFACRRSLSDLCLIA